MVPPAHAGAALLLSWLLLVAPAAAQDPDVRRLGQELGTAPSAALRIEAARALGRASTAMGVRVLQAALPAQEDPSVRLEILRALRTIAFQRYPGYRQALAAIAQAADDASETDELVRLRATEALWEAGSKGLLDPVPVLERQLTDASQRLRLGAVEMLRKLGTPEAAEGLGRAALDTGQSQTVRLAAIEALGAVALTEGGPVGRQVSGANIAAARRFPVPPLVSARALERRHERQIQALSAVARDPQSSPTLVLRAVRSMGQVKDHSSVPVLRQLLATHPHAGVRQQATRVLSHVLARQYE